MSRPEHRETNDREDPDDGASLAGRWRRRLARWGSFDLREQWWNLLDWWETRRGLRRTVYGLLAGVVVLGSLGAWLWPRWRERNAIGMARQWLAAGRLDHADEAVKAALAAAPNRPETWRVASELALRLGKKAEAVTDARQAAQLAPKNPELTLEWAATALVAEQFGEAEKILAAVPAATLAKSAHGQRIAGELARRKGDLTSARDHFEAAAKLDGPAAFDDVPLGLVLIQSSYPAEHRRGLDLLARWAADPGWGAMALRNLLGDALRRDDRAAMRKWAVALRAHPGCTLGDMPDCLLALFRTDPARYAAELAGLEKSCAANPGPASQLITWLNQIGRSADAVQWLKTLPPPTARQPPAVVAAAEALRLTADWTALDAWTKDGDWGPSLDYLRWLYAMAAARRLGHAAHADELWRTLQDHALLNGVHALFAADTLYTWGWRDDAVRLLWRAADRPGMAMQALGTLARHYQTQRDAAGQYRAFRRLYALRPQDPDIGNNLAFFAALTGNETVLSLQIARANHDHFPKNQTYLATYAFVLSMENRGPEALALLQPAAARWKNSPALAESYGLALAGSGQKAEARAVLAALDPATLTTAETELIKSVSN